MANPIFSDAELANIAKLNAMDKANQSNYDPNVPVTPSSYWSSPVNSGTPTYGGSGVSTPSASPAQYQYNPQALAQASADAARQRAEQEAAAKKQQYIDAQTGLYNNYFSQQQNSQLAALKNARDTALQGFNNSERVAQQNAYTYKNQVDATHAQSAQRLRELMASQGLLSSGDNVTANVQLQNQRDSSLNDINQATGNVLQDVAEKRNLAYNQEASQEQSLIDKLSGDKTAALIDLNKYGDQKETDLNKFNYQQYIDTLNNAFRQQQADISNNMNAAQLTGQYNGKDTLAALNAARQDALSRAQLTGVYDAPTSLSGQAISGMPSGIKTLAAQQLDRENRNDNISLAQWLTQQYGVNAAPKSDAGVAFDQVNGMQTLAAQQLGLQNRTANLDAALKVGNAAGKLIAPQSDWGNLFDNAAGSPGNFDSKKFDENVREFGMDYALKQQQQASQAAYQNAQIGLQREKFNYDKDPNNPDNQYKMDQVQARKDQTMYEDGLKAYKETGQMPDYMSKYGINVEGLKDQKSKAEVEGLYQDLFSGKTDPDKALQMIDAAEKLGLKDSAVTAQLRKTVYMINPELDPATKEKKQQDNAQAATDLNNAKSIVHSQNPYLYPWQR